MPSSNKINSCNLHFVELIKFLLLKFKIDLLCYMYDMMKITIAIDYKLYIKVYNGVKYLRVKTHTIKYNMQIQVMHNHDIEMFKCEE